MKRRTWLIAVAAILAAVYVLPVPVFAQETDTTRQAPPDTLQQTPEETPAQTPRETPEETPREMPEEDLREMPEETSGEEMPQETPREAPGETPRTTRTETTQQTPGSVLRPGTTGIKAFSIDLSGDAAVPGPGAGNGSAFVVVNPNKGKVCFALDVSDISRPTDAHIHEGAAGVAGGPVVNFGLATRGLGGCVTNVDADLAKRLVENPSNFYVNVHTEEFPQGALRGQLMSASPGGS